MEYSVLRSTEFSLLKSKQDFQIFTLQEIFARGYDGSNDLSTPHRVDVNCIFYYTSGSGVHSVDFDSYKVSAGSLAFVCKDQVQSLKVSDDCDAYVITFTEQFFYKCTQSSALFLDDPLFFHNVFKPVMHLDRTRSEDLGELVRHIYRDYQFETYGREELLSNYLSVLLLKIAICRFNHENMRVPFDVYQQFLKLKDLINGNLKDTKRSKTRNVSEYAKRMNISTKKLNEITQVVTNKPAKKFLDECVTIEAKRLLAVGDLSVKQVAYELGFEEATNFVKYFKRQTNATPADFYHSEY